VSYSLFSYCSLELSFLFHLEVCHLGPYSFYCFSFITALLFLQRWVVVGVTTGEKGGKAQPWSYWLPAVRPENHPSGYRISLSPYEVWPSTLQNHGGEELTFIPAFLDSSVFDDGSPEVQTLYSGQLFNGGKQNNTYFQYTLASIQGSQKQSINRFRLWYHTKRGVDISGEMVSPLSESTLSWDYVKIAFRAHCPTVVLPHPMCFVFSVSLIYCFIKLHHDVECWCFIP